MIPHLKVAKAPQLRPHDIALDWRALTPQGLPVHPELRPWHVIQIVRLFGRGFDQCRQASVVLGHERHRPKIAPGSHSVSTGT
jgi:hypothetical protein